MAATSNEKRGKLHLDIKLAQVSVLSLSLSLSLYGALCISPFSNELLGKEARSSTPRIAS
jgi:hypothetical protein